MERKTQWHPAFCSAMRLELKENKGDLEYTNEYNVSAKPLQIDLLVIKKEDRCVIQNPIGKIFRRHNIVEFKSPRDRLNIDDYFKVMGYACLYKAQHDGTDDVESDDITISFVRDTKPEGLLREFKRREMTVRVLTDGIYYVANPWFLMQIIVTSELNRDAHLWLTALTERLSVRDAEKILEGVLQLAARDEKSLADSVLTVSISANRKIFGEMEDASEMFESLEFLMEDKFKEKWLEGSRAEKLKTAKRMLKRGRLTHEEIAEDSELSLEEVEKLAQELEDEMQPA